MITEYGVWTWGGTCFWSPSWALITAIPPYPLSWRTIVDRTYGTNKKIYISLFFYNNIWSYLLCPPVVDACQSRTRSPVLGRDIHGVSNQEIWLLLIHVCIAYMFVLDLRIKCFRDVVEARRGGIAHYKTSDCAALHSLLLGAGAAHVCIFADDVVSAGVLPCLPGVLPRAPISRRPNNRINTHRFFGELMDTSSVGIISKKKEKEKKERFWSPSQQPRTFLPTVTLAEKTVFRLLSQALNIKMVVTVTGPPARGTHSYAVR